MRDEVLGALRRGVTVAEADALALALFHWQRRQSPLYAAMTVRADGREPDPQVPGEIPALPVALFKELSVRTFHGPPGRVFFTSGTTGSTRGEHALLDTAVYDEGAWSHFTRVLPDVPARTVSLCPAGDSDSSLGHMVAAFARRAGGELVGAFDPTAGVSPATFAELDRPAFLASTAFSLDALFALDGGARLGPDSLVMVTGGFKGRRVRLDSAELYAEIGRRLGAPRVVGEYGMTELCSQLWTEPVRSGAQPGVFLAPTWLRVYTVDPVTALPVDGEGLLRFVDLANTDSAVAIETMDLGVVEHSASGDRVTLRGRATGSELRGCSLRAEDLLQRR